MDQVIKTQTAGWQLANARLRPVQELEYMEGGMEKVQQCTHTEAAGSD